MPDLWVDVDTNVIVPVNILPLLDDTDFKTIETAIVYNSAGMDLVWNFQTAAGVVTGVAVTPTTGGNYDWSEPVTDKGMYAIEIPASGGASINNDTEGVGWFTGKATGVLPWRGPTIGFRRVALNDLFMDGGTASTNMEDFFDGTGYAGGTAKLGVNVAEISGDSDAADNLELDYDGTGYSKDNSTVGTVSIVSGSVDSVNSMVSANTIQISGSSAAADSCETFFTIGYDMTATSNIINAAIVGSVSADITSISGDSIAADNLEAALDGTGYNVGGGEIVAASVTGAVGSVTGAVGSVTGNVGGNVTGSVGSVASGGITAASIATGAIDADSLATDAVTEIQAGLATAASIAALNNLSAAQVNTEVVDALSVDVIADSVAADGSRPTIAQALLMITRFLTEKSVSSTTVTVNKEDGTTASMTFTLDSATAPTAITRAT